MTREEELDIRQELRIANKVIEEYKEENGNLLDNLKTCVARLKNEIHAPFAIIEAEEVIEKAGFEYTDNPRLENQDDLYYTGCGCTWDTDLDGARYWKRYNPSVMRGDRYGHLSYGDIVNEKARMKKLIKECLSEMD